MSRSCPNCGGTGQVDAGTVQARRMELALKQSEVADAIGITRTAYTNFENGRCNLKPEKLKPLAIMLNWTTDELLEAVYGEQS